MNDPWHAEALEQLVLFLRSRVQVRFAVVVTSSAELERIVVTELRERLGDLVCTDLALDAAATAPLELLAGPPDPRRIVLVSRLWEVAAAQTGSTFDLGVLNLQREVLAARGEALVFLTDEASAAALARQAPDLYRYTISFSFERLEDWIARGQAEEEAELPEESPRASEELYLHWLAEAREAEDPHGIASALLDLTVLRLRDGRIEDARESAEAALAIVRQGTDLELRARVVQTWARVLRDRGQVEEAIVAAEEGYSLAAKPGIPTAVVRQGEVSLADALRAAGRYQDALALLDRAMAADPPIAATRTLVYNRAVTLAVLGRMAEAMNSLQDDAGQAVPRDLRPQAAAAWAIVYLGSGDLRHASESAGMALAHWGSIDPAFRAFRVGSLLGLHGALVDGRARLSAIEIDSIEKASGRAAISVEGMRIALQSDPADEPLSQTARRCIEKCRAAGNRVWTMSAELLAAEVDARIARLPEALNRGEEVRAAFDEMGLATFLADCEQTLSRFHYLAGNLDHAGRFAESAAGRAKHCGARAVAARADTERAYIALARGDAKAARTLSEAALSSIGETRFRIDEPAALAARAAARRLAGEEDDADERRWRRLVRGMGARGLERRIEQSLAAVGMLVEA